jgi:hypothetical protein
MESSLWHTSVPNIIWGKMLVDKGFSHETFTYFILWEFFSTAYMVAARKHAMWGEISPFLHNTA